jgi:O-antigen/teichoic acid export membrane protein
MIDEARVTIRNVGLLLAQRGLYIAGGLLFAVLVPRLMGPDSYGRYALISSLSVWFAMFADLGLTQIIGRYVPLIMLQKNGKDLQKLFGNLLAVSIASGALSSGLYLILTGLCLGDLEILVLATMAGIVFVRCCARPFFTLFLGLNHAARWGIAEIVRCWISLTLMLPGFWLWGLWGACLGLLLTEILVLALGVWLGRSYLSWPEVRLDIHYLAPYLRFGLIFFITGLLHTGFHRSGEVLVRIFYGNYAQVAYFGLAYNVYFAASVVIPQLTLAFSPLMTALLAEGETDVLKRWVEHLIKWLTVGCVSVVFGVLLLGNDLVPTVFGKAYEPVTENLLLLSIALLANILTSTATLLSLIYNQPKVALASGAVRLGAFWVFGLPLIAWFGSPGGCLAALLASMLCAGYFTRRMQRVVNYSIQKWTLAIALGLPFLLLLGWQSSWLVNGVLYVIFVIGYFILLFFLRVIRPSEVVAVWRALHSRGEIINWPKS